MTNIVFKFFRFLGFPLTFFSALWLRFVRRAGIGVIEEKLLMAAGVLPVVDFYYQPLVNPKKHLTKSLRDDRELPGVDFNTAAQLDLLAKFNYNDELLKFPLEKDGQTAYYYNNPSYGSGDGEYLYNMIRHFKPRCMIEIGSGMSTLMARNAFLQNKADDGNYQYSHICIEPYEMPWLEQTGVEVMRKKVEDIDKSFFARLGANDILFIDSSHIIRPQGDVLFEYLELLPMLNAGVIVHAHDIFMPKDYPDEWIYKQHLLWNEQYLLEAFLTCNDQFKMIGAVNYLSHNYREELSAKCPVYAQQPGREPGAFWMVKTG